MSLACVALPFTVIHGNASSVDACYDLDLDSNASSNRGRRGAEFARYPLNGHVDRMYAAGIPLLFTAKDGHHVIMEL